MNRLAANGGRPYIKTRLWRAPNETDTQWKGDPEEGIVGRVQRSCLINDAGRIRDKISQYIFKTQAQRDGADQTFLDNVGKKLSVNEFMRKVNDAITTGQWAWVQVNRTPQQYDANGKPLAKTLANAGRVSWRLWESVNIPDWCITPDGEIVWLIVRTEEYINTDPTQPGKTVKISTLYRKEDDGKVYVTEECDNATAAKDMQLKSHWEFKGLDRIPFVLIGKPSYDAWWFDDVENIQAQVMNYDSMHNETITDSIFPQLVVPMSLLGQLQTNLALDNMGAKEVITLQRELIKGRKNPFYETPEDRGTTRYLTPSSADLKMVTDEQGRKRALLFDMAGLALFNKETRQIQTAESKQFDQLDTNSTLGYRALLLETAEKDIIALSKVFDPTFKEWKPVYNKKFDVVDVTALSAAITATINLPNVTPLMKKACLRGGGRIILELGAISQEEYDAIIDEINKMPNEQLTAAVVANPFEELLKKRGEEGDDPAE